MHKGDEKRGMVVWCYALHDTVECCRITGLLLLPTVAGVSWVEAYVYILFIVLLFSYFIDRVLEILQLSVILTLRCFECLTSLGMRLSFCSGQALCLVALELWVHCIAWGIRGAH